MIYYLLNFLLSQSFYLFSLCKKELASQFFFLFYSVLNAITGSFLLAILDGINPAMIVKTTLITTNVIPAPNGTAVTTFTFVKA